MESDSDTAWTPCAPGPWQTRARAARPAILFITPGLVLAWHRLVLPTTAAPTRPRHAAVWKSSPTLPATTVGGADVSGLTNPQEEVRVAKQLGPFFLLCHFSSFSILCSVSAAA